MRANVHIEANVDYEGVEGKSIEEIKEMAYEWWLEYIPNITVTNVEE